MENPTNTIKPFLVDRLPKEKYTDVNELAKDIANALAIEADKLTVNLIALNDLKGEKGDKGNKGIKGDTGLPGPSGATGATGPTGPGLVWRGVWDSTSEMYVENDLVEYNGVIYICYVDNTSSADTEPNVGVDWTDVWNIFFTGVTTVVVGTTTNDDAAAGKVGEFIENSDTASALVDSTPTDVVMIGLTAGDWDISAMAQFVYTNPTDSTYRRISISIASGAHGDIIQDGIELTGQSIETSMVTHRVRVSSAAGDNVYLVAECAFSAGDVDVFGIINARRVR